MAGLCLGASSVALADNIVINGGFETAGSGGAADSFGWVEVANGAPGSLSMRDGAVPRTGAFSHHIVAFGSNAIGANSALSQNSAEGGLALQQNTTLSASYSGRYNLGPGGVGFYVLRVLNGAGQIVAQTPLGVITGGTSGAYQTFNVGPVNVPAYGAAPNDVYYAFLELNVAAGAFEGSSAEAFIDDVSIDGTLVGGIPTGACCVPGTGCVIATEAACSGTGTYQGNGTTCANNPCTPPATGACCVQGSGCSVTTQALCTGTYQGDGTTCVSNPCPVENNLAFNGGFEIAGFGGPTDPFGWSRFASGGPGSLSDRDGTSPRNGEFAQHILTFGAEAIGGSSGISQNTLTDGGQLSLQQNTQVTASYSGKYNLGVGGVGFRTLRILNSAGAIVATSGLQVITGSNSSYQTFTMGPVTVPAFGAPPNDSYAAFVEMTVAAGAFVGSSAEAFIDDVVINGVVVSGPTCPWQGDTCFADYNNDGGIDGDDVIAFFGDWDASNACADVDGSGGVDGDDVIAFFSSWDAGGIGQAGC
jgi:hypothetical protein